MPTYVTGAEILTAAGVDSPDTDAQTWADDQAAAVQAAIDTRMEGVTVDPDSDAYDELHRAAIIDGVAAYIAKDAPQGVLSSGPDQTPVRLGADILRACLPVIHRHHPTAGIGIG